MNNDKLVNTICEHIQSRLVSNELSNDDMVKIIEQLGLLLNLKTIPDYAKDNNLSYNGVKNFRTIKTIFNVQFVIDNE